MVLEEKQTARSINWIGSLKIIVNSRRNKSNASAQVAAGSFQRDYIPNRAALWPNVILPDTASNLPRVSCSAQQGTGGAVSVSDLHLTPELALCLLWHRALGPDTPNKPMGISKPKG